MGFGYPAAVGAKVARPDKEVIDIDGDGSFIMNIQELATASIEKINAKCLLPTINIQVWQCSGRIVMMGAVPRQFLGILIT